VRILMEAARVGGTTRRAGSGTATERWGRVARGIAPLLAMICRFTVARESNLEDVA
jgi:hypothetical protein